MTQNVLAIARRHVHPLAAGESFGLQPVQWRVRRRAGDRDREEREHHQPDQHQESSFATPGKVAECRIGKQGAEVISNDVWSRLNPATGMAGGISYPRWFLAGLVIALACVTWGSGAIVPHLSAGNGHVNANYRDGVSESDVFQEVVNDGWFPATISRVGVPADDAYVLRSASLDGDRRVPAGGKAGVSLRMTVTDCAVLGRRDLPLLFEVEQWWGRTTVEVTPEDPLGAGPCS
ncbi:hypothetical protein [Nonomuraea sp. NPDC050783]|uniref:hypothetical protein n=1 Tax=Nonomuraea sp. NPDC050783 TaxID=3154634 RepID=UPI0034679305